MWMNLALKGILSKTPSPRSKKTKFLTEAGRLAYSYNPSVREAWYWNDTKAIYTKYVGFMVNLCPQ